MGSRNLTRDFETVFERRWPPGLYSTNVTNPSPFASFFVNSVKWDRGPEFPAGGTAALNPISIARALKVFINVSIHPCRTYP